MIKRGELTSDLVEERGPAGVLGLVDAVAPELGTETRVGPGEVWGGGGLLVFG